MPKYYIKINQSKFIVDQKSYDNAIKTILSKYKNTFELGSKVYISEIGFDYTSWICSKIDKYLLNR